MCRFNVTAKMVPAHSIYKAELESYNNSHALRLIPDGPTSPVLVRLCSTVIVAGGECLQVAASPYSAASRFENLLFYF